ncbi:MAG: DUF3078 domain-containing protein [Flavobacteriales bacterium]|nr:DUF3078 domain-containing protein [Flavobacteriales bacterium]
MRWVIRLVALAWGNLAAQSIVTPLGSGEETRLRAPVVSDADTVYQKQETLINVQFSQVQLSQWAAGGQSSASLIAKLDQFWEYDGTTLGWDTELHAAFGLLHRPDENSILKTDDRIELVSKIGYRLKDKGALTALGSFRTQMAPGFAAVNGVPDPSQVTSRFMAPGYLVVALGLDLKPTPTTTVFLAPFTSKSTYVLDESLSAAGMFGVAPGEQARHEVGGYIRLGLKEQVTENVTYAVRLDLFSNYLEEPEAVDIFSDHVLTLKVNDWLSTTLGLTLIYDKDVELVLREPDPDIPGDNGEMGPGVQLKQILAVGLSLKFS